MRGFLVTDVGSVVCRTVSVCVVTVRFRSVSNILVAGTNVPSS